MSRAELIKYYSIMVAIAYIKIFDLKRLENKIGTDPVIMDCLDHARKVKNIYLRNLRRAQEESQYLRATNYFL